MSDGESTRKDLGKKLKLLRKDKKMTQVQTAGGLGMNYRHYQDIEAGKSDLKVSSLVKIAGFFGLPLSQLMDGKTFSGVDLIVEMKKFMSTFGNHMVVPITLRDMDGLIVTCNKACLALGNYTLEEIEGQHFSKFAQEGELEFYNQMIAQENQGQFKPFVFKYLTKEGIGQSVNYYPVPIIGGDGLPTAVFAILCPEKFEITDAASGQVDGLL